MPTHLALTLLNEYRTDLQRRQQDKVDSVCLAIIKGSLFPVATALQLPTYMDDNAELDPRRADQWRHDSDVYKQIAVQLVDGIEDDHLLAMLLELPTDTYHGGRDGSFSQA